MLQCRAAMEHGGRLQPDDPPEKMHKIRFIKDSGAGDASNQGARRPPNRGRKSGTVDNAAEELDCEVVSVKIAAKPEDDAHNPHSDVRAQAAAVEPSAWPLQPQRETYEGQAWQGR